MEEFIKNFKISGGEIFEIPPKNWYEVNGNFGVIENGSIFISNYHKELFLQENIIIYLNKDKLFDKMTDVMELIDTGIFICGPSKTADVESFLVFGAHGPMRLGVIFI